MNAGHPSLEQLSQLVEGQLGAYVRSRVEHHVAQCRRCSAELAMLTATIARLRAERTRRVDPGGDAAESICTDPARQTGGRADAQGVQRESFARRARRLFQPVAMDATSRFVGALRFDSARMAPAFGIRTSSSSDVRQLLFEAGPFELELHASAARAGWSISGQLLGPTDATSGEVRLIGPKASARSNLTEMLEFNLPAVPSGRYRLELLLAGTTQVEIESLELGP